MNFLEWFSKEAREKRQHKREAIQEIKHYEKTIESIDEVQNILKQNPETTISTLWEVLVNSRKQCTPPQNETIQEALFKLTALEAVTFLFFAENYVLVRKTTTDAHGLGNYQAGDEPSWPELAATCMDLVEKTRELKSANQPETIKIFLDTIKERALITKNMSAEELEAKGHKFPIYPIFQSGAASATVNYSLGAWGTMAVVSKRVEPKPQIRTVFDFEERLKNITGWEWFYDFNNSLDSLNNIPLNKCISCGDNVLTVNSKYCSNCGASIE